MGSDGGRLSSAAVSLRFAVFRDRRRGGGTPVTCTPTLVENKRKNKYRRDVRECKQVCIFPVSGNKREPTTDTRKTSTFTFFFFCCSEFLGDGCKTFPSETAGKKRRRAASSSWPVSVAS